jgi:hypothetical protein
VHISPERRVSVQVTGVAGENNGDEEIIITAEFAVPPVSVTASDTAVVPPVPAPELPPPPPPPLELPAPPGSGVSASGFEVSVEDNKVLGQCVVMRLSGCSQVNTADAIHC